MTEIRNLFGIPIAALTMAQMMDRVAAAITSRQRLLIGVVNAAKVVSMRRDPELRQAVLNADVVVADGIGVVWASRILGAALPERVTGIDLMMHMLRRGSAEKWGVYCLGATQEVLDRVISHIGIHYPGVRIVGHRNGYFSTAEEAEVAAGIRASRADILLVAMTSPKKEQFLARWQPTLDVPVCHGVGGSFDVVAGKVQRAPESWQRLGLEWLYRVMQEPGRLWRRYLVTNVAFCALVLRELVRSGARKARSGR